MSYYSNYKYCIVPMCTNTSISAPDKVFITVPKVESVRRTWCSVMKRDIVSTKSTRHVCEDHFDLEKDVTNYCRYKLQGGKIFLAKDVVPHKFECQRPVKPTRTTGIKRNRDAIIASIMNSSVTAVTNVVPPIATDLNEPSTSDNLEEIVPTDHVRTTMSEDKSTQVCLRPKVRSVGIYVNPKVRSSACSPTKFSVDCGTSTSPLKDEKKNSSRHQDYDESEHIVTNIYDWDDCDFIPTDSESDYVISDSEDKDFKKSMRIYFLIACEKKSLSWLGVPKDFFYLVELLSQKINCQPLNVMLTLKKIRLNESFDTLSVHFGMSKSNVAKIFKETARFIAIHINEFIFWPEADKIKESLPIAFRARYAKVATIIDCFEIQIEKPSDPVYQALTWSSYYNCNTLKYLLSCTPDGHVSFVSKGYGGRVSDITIVEDSGFLQKLSPGMMVMADRGFKNISPCLSNRQCHLVRPPTVLANIKCSKEDVKASKRIAGLRIHVERVIRGVRDFHMLLPHACVDNKLIQTFDNIVIIACALLNIQNKIIKT